ncbi:MAG: hypothetical protein KF724_05895 [Phycisphaeraceae bacterium]|nr:hypothetical protein [Phycisphaeraceae bacterium]
MARSHPPIILFDDGLGRFGPLTDLRASFELRSGALSNIERLAPVAALWSAPDLAPLLDARHSLPVNRIPEGVGEVLLLNGRLLDARRFVDATTPLFEKRSGHLVAARLSAAAALRWLEHGDLSGAAGRVEEDGTLLAARPWDLLEPSSFAARIADDVRQRFASLPSLATRAGVTVIGAAPALAHSSATVLPGVIIDAQEGPVVIDEGATIRPGAVLVGPTFIGARSIVAERALLKARTVIGPHCRAAGEIGNTIFQGFSNKAHDGHLGDSFVGEWVNLGAGTTNSNLLNTYGEVTLRLEADAPLERSGRQFLGSIIGDHAKTAILTRLTTGCVIGTGAMIATSVFAPAFVPRFAWLTDDGSRLYRFEKFIEVARAVWSRRGVTMPPAMEARLRALHKRSRGTWPTASA